MFLTSRICGHEKVTELSLIWEKPWVPGMLDKAACLGLGMEVALLPQVFSDEHEASAKER